LATYLDEGLADAAQRHAALVVITMDTPGGLSDSMKDIVQHILASPVPVAVYVTPTGARGASAGFYILLSADIAAMAPGTHTGAASPIMVIGGIPTQLDEVFRKKINQDAMAFLRSFTEKRGRNPTLSETAITDAKAFTDKEALDAKMIDLIAPSLDDLLRQLDGRTITRFDGSKITLALHNATQTSFELSGREKFLSRIVEPDIFFVLLIIGVLGLYTEFTHPGVIAPGVIGGISLVLALYAMHFLPVNFAGVFFNSAGSGLFHPGSKVHQPRRTRRWRHSFHVVRRHVFDTLAPDRFRGQPLCSPGRHRPVRHNYGFSDAAGAALPQMEIGHRQRRIAR
jgi:membrane-bound serine protease (ClpP class)